ncbi:glutamate--tRNA ligase [Candidatus Gottesmanbacteria bacterium RBG_13_45_10]|uniref:Glutamate--tRNA ligase n=1 Tax=Candidatus Gottesmanbacteria bacterium RBG_13_45_10 TaxID=1798370 RepID=A0A1F5ZGL9_9BACT|nr:MAG: glutamate--tRNA ligase [Candidatus Gottesmanbacteria bacterium RBG_13_45_10]
MTKVRTRIAPSPTGQDLHIGNAYTALINSVFAKKNNGQFIIRIEDTDRTRFVEGSEERILASLHWLGIPHNEGPDNGGPFAPYRQSDRLPQYKKYAEELIAKGHAYYCFCSPQRLEQMRKDQEKKHLPPMYDGCCKAISAQQSAIRVKNGEKYVIRLSVPDEGVTTFHDVVRGDISFENILIDDQVLLKSDGFPTYHLGVVVDDHLMEISHIIRGEEWISSTPKHILLYYFFGWELPVFAHMPLLRNPDKSKLSKRKNPVWVSWYKEEGFLPEAVCNYLATMAWAFPEGRDIFSLEEMIREFTLENVQTTAPVFDIEKLRWMNGEYLRRMSDEKLIELIYQHVTMLTSTSAKATADRHELDSLMDKILPLVKERMKTLNEFWSLAGFFFERPKEFERPLNKKFIEILQDVLSPAEWKHDKLELLIRITAETNEMKAKDLFMELRVAVTGKTVGPPLLESLEILGKEETLSRLK